MAKDITDAARCKAQLLLLAGCKVYDIYDTLSDDADDFAATKTKLNNYFKPLKDEAMAVFQFREEVQKPGESVDQFVTRLRAQAKHCGFTDKSKEIRAQVLQKTINKKLRRESLKNPTWDLNAVLKEARAIENSEARAGDIEGREETINRIRNKPPLAMQDRQGQKQEPSVHKCDHCGCHAKDKPHKPRKKESFENSDICGHCGGKWPHEGGRKKCPAFGKTCRKCGRENHFERVCRQGKSERINMLMTDDANIHTQEQQEVGPRRYCYDDQYVF